MISSNWNEYLLKGWIEVQSGYAFKTEQFIEKGIPIVKIGNLANSKTVKTNDDSFVDASLLDSLKDYLLSYNDVLIAMSGNTTSKMGRVTNDFVPSLVNQRVGWVKPISAEIDIDFIYYLLTSEKYQRRLWNAATATGQPNLSPRDIKRLKFYKPSLPEQRKIASILTKVDDAIQAVKNTIEKAELLKKSLMQNLLTGKLKPDGSWRTDDEFYVDEKFGKYPKSWAFGRFKEFSVLQRGKDLTDIDVINGEYPVVKSNGIQIYHNNYFVEPPGVVTGRSGTIGKVFYIEEKFWAHNTSLYVKDFKGNNEKYIYYLIKRMKFDQYFAGTTVPTLNRNDIHKIKVAIPKSIDEQIEIVKKIDSADQIIGTKQQKIQKLERLKKALMQNLLTGKVRVKV